MNDILFYVADKNMAEAVRGLLERPQVHRIVGCAPFAFDARQDIRVAAGHNDPGIFVRGNELLRPFGTDYAHAVVIVDEEWDGSPGAEVIEGTLRGHLYDAGWSEVNSLGLVVCPEADVWLWSDSPHSAGALGWSSWEELRAALEVRGLLAAGRTKPDRPKEAAEWALRNASKRRPRSAALYQEVSSRASIKRCQDASLIRLLDTLRAWFPAEVA